MKILNNNFYLDIYFSAQPLRFLGHRMDNITKAPCYLDYTTAKPNLVYGVAAFDNEENDHYSGGAQDCLLAMNIFVDLKTLIEINLITV